MKWLLSVARVMTVLLLFALSAALAAASGYVIITADPGTEIYLDEVWAGTVEETGILTLALPEGPYRITAARMVWVDESYSVVVDAARPALVHFAADPVRDPEPSETVVLPGVGLTQSRPGLVFQAPPVVSEMASSDRLDHSALDLERIEQRMLTGIRERFSLEQIVWHMRLAPAAIFRSDSNAAGMGAVAAPYWIGETEVTLELWNVVAAWAEANGYRLGRARGGQLDHPAVLERWTDILVWCNALSEYMGLEPVYLCDGFPVRDAGQQGVCENAVPSGGSGFRLPTAAEWELAARYLGPQRPDAEPLRSQAYYLDGLYWTPGNYASGAANSVYHPDVTQAVAWYLENSFGYTKPVALKDANALGLFDMSGNISELVYARYLDYRFLRGGSGADNLDDISLDVLHYHRSTESGRAMGFRLAKNFYQ